MAFIFDRYQCTDKENSPNKQSPGRTHTHRVINKTPMLLTPDPPQIPCKAASQACQSLGKRAGGLPRERTLALRGTTSSSGSSWLGTASGRTTAAKNNGDTAMLFSSSPTERQDPCYFIIGMRERSNATSRLSPTPFRALFVSPAAQPPPHCIPNQKAVTLLCALTVTSQPSISHRGTPCITQPPRLLLQREGWRR